MGSIVQDILDGYPLPRRLGWKLIPVTSDPTWAIDTLLELNSPTIGVAIQLTAGCVLDAVAFAAEDQVLVFPVGSGRRSSPEVRPTAHRVLERLLESEITPLAGFSMAHIAMHIKNGLSFRVSGIDISTLRSESTRAPLTPAQCVKMALVAAADADTYSINKLWHCSPGEDDSGYIDLCKRAWLSVTVAKQWHMHFSSVAKVDTNWLSDQHFECLYQMLSEFERMEFAKAPETENDFSIVGFDKMGGVVIQNTRFKTRVRASEQTRIVMTDADGQEYYGSAKGAKGKQTMVEVKNSTFKDIQRVRVLGREEWSSAEKARDELILLLLQGSRFLENYPFICLLWFPSAISTRIHQKVNSAVAMESLNKSQANVVEAMTATDERLLIVHGPPGTGKTSTISAAIERWYFARKPVWIIAQSNVGVKNIAESLCKNKVDFKLIVSKEFHYEWHEHIYEQVADSIVRSDELPSDPQSMAYLLEDVQVMLCTLSMLSNPSLQQKHVFNLVPVERIVVDEASQISVFNYMHLFVQFNRTLEKVCFFGDPKQLPPFGQEAAPSLQCIFDLKHLKPQAYFLNTQYRMPVPLGDFISSEVYDSKLKSVHAIQDQSCVAFIDVSLGEEEKAGKSWKNEREIQTVLHLVKYYYAKADFCVITPYDGQRAALQNALEKENLPSERVFNVDSFQGNEAKYVIVSVVRTTGPGFLTSQKRVNVMLTRCKAGMVIVTKHGFLRSGSARETLLGKLSAHWEASAGRMATWKDWKDVAEEKADLPGVRGRRTVETALPVNHGPLPPGRLQHQSPSWIIDRFAAVSLQGGNGMQAQAQAQAEISPRSGAPKGSWRAVARSPENELGMPANSQQKQPSFPVLNMSKAKPIALHGDWKNGPGIRILAGIPARNGTTEVTEDETQAVEVQRKSWKIKPKKTVISLGAFRQTL